MRRVFLPLALALLICLTVGLVLGGAVASNAVVVNGTAISQSEVNHDLAAVANSPSYLCYLNANALIRSSGQFGLGSVAGSSSSSYSAGFVTNWLNQDVTNLIISHEVDSLGLTSASAENTAIAAQDLATSINSTMSQVAGTRYQCVGTGTTVLSGLPASVSSKLIKAQSDSEVLLAHLGGIGLDQQSLQQFYNQSPSSFDTICISGILVANQATAATLRAQIEAGADFATVAAQNSVDASKANGGSLGCFAPTSANYQSVVKDVGSLNLGDLTQPLPSQGSQYVILKVTSRSSTPFTSIGSAVRQSALVKDATAASAAASSLVRSASVNLNPRYGTWHATLRGTGIVPPASPPTAAILNLKANLPGASN